MAGRPISRAGTRPLVRASIAEAGTPFHLRIICGVPTPSQTSRAGSLPWERLQLSSQPPYPHPLHTHQPLRRALLS